MQLQGKKIGIIGLSNTGIACIDYLKQENQLICFDDDANQLNKIALLYGQHIIAKLDDPRWQEIQYLVASPGVPLYFPVKHKILEVAKQAKITSDIELFYQDVAQAKFAAITGTNGKSTTASLLFNILQDEGYQLGGNIGTPCLKLKKANGYILELSSFQLDLLENFKPKVAAITNITPDHLDRYPSMLSYIDSKLSIAKNLDSSDCLILNIDDANLQKASSSFSLKTNVVTTSVYKKADVYWQDGCIVDGEKKYPFQQTYALAGQHNLQNILIAYAAATRLGISPQQALAKISSFTGLAHRMQYVATTKNVSFYNDSKATNAQATSFALKALDNIFWLAGGIAKAGGIQEILAELSKVKKAYFFGKDKTMLAQQAQGFTQVALCDTMEQALKLAWDDAKKLDKKCNILLSPACASLDQFKNFEDRGQQFIKLIKTLT